MANQMAGSISKKLRKDLLSALYLKIAKLKERQEKKREIKSKRKQEEQEKKLMKNLEVNAADTF